MTISIILILAVLWAAFFLWPLVQRRLEGGSRNAIGSFAKGLGAVGSIRSRSLAPLPIPSAPNRSVGLSSVAPSVRAEGLPMSQVAQRRRRDALMVVGGAVLATLLLAIVTASMIAWAVQLFADIAFAAYVVALVSIRRRAEEHHAKVHFLPQPVHTPSPLVLRRSVSS